MNKNSSIKKDFCPKSDKVSYHRGKLSLNFDEGYPTGLAAVPVQTASLVVMAAMAPMKSVAGTAVGVAVSTLVAAGVAVVSAEAADRQQDFSDSLLSTDGDGCLCF